MFFLKDTAFQWFDNHEDDINSWDGFKTSFSEAFRKPESRKQQAKEKLSHRFQAATETSTSYIEDVLRLCRRVDEQMSEEDKIRHLFKGLSQELFSVVAPKTPATVQRLISECKTYEEMQSSRINKAPFERLPEVSLSPVSNLNLPQLIRTIIRDELRRYFNPSSLTDDASGCAIEPETIQKVVQKELRAALQPPTSVSCAYAPASPATPAFSPLCPIQPMQQRYTAPFHTHERPPSRSYGPQRRADLWRTEDNRPICFYCHAPGHVTRYCRRRISQETFQRGTPSYYCNDTHTSNDRRDGSPLPTAGNRRSRSPSPYPARRRSVSPFNNATAPTLTSN